MDSFGASRGRRKKRLGDLLIEGGLINDEQLQQALQAQKESDVRQKLGTVLIDLGFASDDDIAEVLSRQLNLTRVRLADLPVCKWCSRYGKDWLRQIFDGAHLAGRKWSVWNLSNDHRKYLCYSRSDHCRCPNWNFGSSIFGKVLP